MIPAIITSIIELIKYYGYPYTPLNMKTTLLFYQGKYKTFKFLIVPRLFIFFKIITYRNLILT